MAASAAATIDADNSVAGMILTSSFLSLLVIQNVIVVCKMKIL